MEVKLDSNFLVDWDLLMYVLPILCNTGAIKYITWPSEIFFVNDDLINKDRVTEKFNGH